MTGERETLEQHGAYWTHDCIKWTDGTLGDHLYYFAPTNRTAPPYRKQIKVEAIIDIASDGTLAGVELIERMPPPPAAPPSPSGLREACEEAAALMENSAAELREDNWTASVAYGRSAQVLRAALAAAPEAPKLADLLATHKPEQNHGEVWEPEVPQSLCLTCLGKGKLLHFYGRGPNSPPGNTCVGCPDCPAGREYDRLVRGETQVPEVPKPPEPPSLRDSILGALLLEAAQAIDNADMICGSNAKSCHAQNLTMRIRDVFSPKAPEADRDRLALLENLVQVCMDWRCAENLDDSEIPDRVCDVLDQMQTKVAMTAPKLCRDCRWCEIKEQSSAHGHFLTQCAEPSHGGFLSTPFARSPKGLCGPEGRLWEGK